MLDEPKYIDFGLQLVEGCEDTYNQASVTPALLRYTKIGLLTSIVDVDGDRSGIFRLGQFFCASRSS